MKKKMVSEEEDNPGGESSLLIYEFPMRSLMESMFAGSFVKNLAMAAKSFKVTASCLDLTVRIRAEEPQNAQKFLDFLKELEKVASAGGKLMDQRDFEQILAACRTSSVNYIQTFFANRIKVSPKKREVTPRTPNQLFYTKCIREKDMVFGIGPAGTGKTYLAMALAVSELLAGNFSRIVLTRPAVEAGENLGFLPGKLEDKINPYLRPLYDALYDMLEFDEANSLIERGIIEVAPLAFMRGRTLSNSFIILDEAQNATHEQMLMLLTRIGFKSKCVIAGDPSQIDLPYKRASGLAEAVRRLENIPEIAVCHFASEDVLRHTLVEKIIEAYRTPEPEEGEGAAGKIREVPTEKKSEKSAGRKKNGKDGENKND